MAGGAGLSGLSRSASRLWAMCSSLGRYRGTYLRVFIFFLGLILGKNLVYSTSQNTERLVKNLHDSALCTSLVLETQSQSIGNPPCCKNM